MAAGTGQGAEIHVVNTMYELMGEITVDWRGSGQSVKIDCALLGVFHHVRCKNGLILFHC